MNLAPSTRSGIPCASLCKSFPNDLPQTCLYWGLIIRNLYSNNSPVLLSNTALAYSHKNCKGRFQDAACLGAHLVALSDISTVDSSKSWASVLVAVLDLIVATGVSSCSSSCWVGYGLLGCAASSYSTMTSISLSGGSDCFSVLALYRDALSLSTFLADFALSTLYFAALVLKISINFTSGSFVSQPWGIPPSNVVDVPFTAFTNASTIVSFGMVKYLCLKNTVCAVLILIVSLTHIL